MVLWADCLTTALVGQLAPIEPKQTDGIEPPYSVTRCHYQFGHVCIGAPEGI